MSFSVCSWKTFLTRSQCYKTFYGRKLRIFIKARGIPPGEPFQPSSVFAGKAGA
jgi:hypothetical protein